MLTAPRDDTSCSHPASITRSHVFAFLRLLLVYRRRGLCFAQAAPRGVMQSETQLEGDEEEKAPLLEEGGFFRFSGELNTERAASVSFRPGRALMLVGHGETLRCWRPLYYYPRLCQHVLCRRPRQIFCCCCLFVSPPLLVCVIAAEQNSCLVSSMRIVASSPSHRGGRKGLANSGRGGGGKLALLLL